MSTFLATAHLITFILFINCASGNFAVPIPRKPVLYAYGWPKANKVIARVETISIEGIVSYDLSLKVADCPDDSFNPTGKCSSNVTDFTPIKKCHHVENDSSLLTGKDFQCTVCNNSKNCESWNLFSNYQVICTYLKVTTQNGSVCPSCSCKAYSNSLVILPVKSLQLLPVSRRELKVLWERPEGMEGPDVFRYQVILRDHLGKCQGNIKDVEDQLQGNQTRNTYSFTNLMPWSRYSVIVCLFLMGGISVNETTCTCGDHRHQPKGPIFNKTLPEEPTEGPDMQPCQAQCSGTKFTVTLKWKAGDSLVWNGIPEKSVIRIYQKNSSSQSLEELYQNKSLFGSPVKTIHVPLAPNYNGSLVSYSVSNLNSKWTYPCEVQFCSNGGCGPPSAMAMLSCNSCELLGPLSTGFPTTVAHYNSGDSTLWAIISVCFVFVLGAIVIVVCIISRKNRRPENQLRIQEVVGPLPTHVYEYPESTQRASDGELYCELFSSETHLLNKTQQDTEQG